MSADPLTYRAPGSPVLPATSAGPLTAAAQPGVLAPRSLATALAPGGEGDFAVVDASVRLPVLLFFGSSILWLLMSSAFGALAALKLNLPWMLSDFGWLTIGRLYPLAISSFAYGWAASAGIGAALWIMARLTAVPLRFGGLTLAAWLLWNLGLSLGVFGVMYGHGTSFDGLEFPRYASPVLFTAFVFLAVQVLVMFRFRQQDQLYISQWYILAAFLWFPWSYATANLLLFMMPVQAPAQAVIGAWYAHGFMATWFVPLALAIAYYVVPKVLGQPIHRYGLAKFGFWTWLIFAGWGGTYGLIGGPIPAWMSSLAIVSTLLTLLPLFAIWTNFSETLQGRLGGLRHSPSLRFVTVAVWLFLAAGVLAVPASFRSINEMVHFTLLVEAQKQLIMYGGVSLALFGAVYYIVPRLLGVEWETAAFIRVHFWFAVVGLGLGFTAYALGGAIQGLGLNDPKVPTIVLLSFVKPFLFTQLVAQLVLTVGHVFFTANFALILARLGWLSYRRPVIASAPPVAAVATVS